MGAIQTSYSDRMGKAVAGMIADMQISNRISRTLVSGTLGFGQPVVRVSDHQCILATEETLEAAGAAGTPAPAGATITAAPAVSAGAKEGVYTATAIVGGATTTSKWAIEDPDGVLVGIATGNTEFAAGGLTFTITDSGADPVVGEQFTITVTPSGATADLDVLGLAIKDTGLVHTTADQYEADDSVSILDYGTMWVTAGATVTAGQQVYWDPADGRYTNVATDLKINDCVFETGGADGELVIVKLQARKTLAA